MLRASIEHAREGMELAVPVFHPRSAQRLLAEGYRLDAKAIRRLRELGVPEIWVTYPNTELIRGYISPRVMQRQSQVLSAVAEMFNQLHANIHARLDYGEYQASIRELIESLAREPTAAAYVSELSGRADSDFRHAAAVSTIALLLGLKLQDYLIHERSRLNARQAKNVVNLALGAMLHDIGALHLPEALRLRARADFDCRDPMWLKHPTIGYDAVAGHLDPTAAVVVLQHHQYYDGSGYPHSSDNRALSGHDIHIFARIVCVANFYDRLRRPPAARPRLRVEALHALLQPPYIDRCDPIILRALFEVIPAYAPGSVVTLSTGDRAIVMNWNQDMPCRPMVQVVPDGCNDPIALVQPQPDRDFVEPVHYDLAQCPDVEIVEQDGVDVRPFNFDLHRQVREAA